jgi:hypothetical protein
MFLTKKTFIILFLICLIIFFYIKFRKTDNYINVTDISNVIFRLYDNQKKDDILKKISEEIKNKGIVSNNICIGNNLCFSDVKDEILYYDETSNTYFFNKLKNKDVNTKKICINDSCISSEMIDSLNKNTFLSRLNKNNLFNSHESIIYPDLDNFDLRGHFISLMNVTNEMRVFGQLASPNVKRSRNTIYTCFNNSTFEIFFPAVSNCANSYKLPFNDAKSKYVLKLNVQHQITQDTLGIHINLHRLQKEYDISFNTLWLNIPNYVYSTFKVNLVETNIPNPTQSTQPSKGWWNSTPNLNINSGESSFNTVVKWDYGSFGGGLRLKNLFDDKLQFYDGSGSLFEWVPIPLSSYPNIYDSLNNRLCIGLDRAQSLNTTNELDIKGFMISGIGFSTNPYNFCRISPPVLFYNESNQRAKNFSNSAINFTPQSSVQLEELKNAKASTAAPSISTNIANIPYLGLKTISDISGLIIKKPEVKFSIQIVKPLQNKRKLIYVVGATEKDVKSISQLFLSVTPTGDYSLNLTSINNYPPYSLTSIPNIMGVIVNEKDFSPILTEYFFRLTIVSKATDSEPINIIEIGSFDVNINS